jgi:hypothetical protein
MKHSLHSHCSGGEIVPAAIRKELESAIGVVAVKPTKGAATKLRRAIIERLKISGWSDETAVAQGSKIKVTSIKSNVGLCVQTGNMARMYADLIKLQTLYLNNAIKSAIIVVPSEPVAKLLGSNIAQAKRLARELDIFKKAYHVPTLIFALE